MWGAGREEVAARAETLLSSLPSLLPARAYIEGSRRAMDVDVRACAGVQASAVRHFLAWSSDSEQTAEAHRARRKHGRAVEGSGGGSSHFGVRACVRVG